MPELCALQTVDFPLFSGIDINMMPFRIGDAASVPAQYQDYWPLIEACGIEDSECGRIGYLSIMESHVPKGHAQRRRGIHTDGHGSSAWGWGRGAVENGERLAGLYMASNMGNSCRAWDVHIEAPGEAGDCEALREYLESMPATYMEANRIYWMTDRCPHESLPLEAAMARQWFRVVTHAVDVWYEYHSTKNELGILPSGTIIYGSKFTQERLPS